MDLKTVVKLTMGTDEDRLIVKEILLKDEKLMEKYAYLNYLIGTTSRDNDFKDLFDVDINSYEFYTRGSDLFGVSSRDIKKRIKNLLK